MKPPFPVVGRVWLYWATDLPWRKIREKKEETPLDELCAGKGFGKGATLSQACHLLPPLDSRGFVFVLRLVIQI